jgi:phosphohistidine phosphatase
MQLLVIRHGIAEDAEAFAATGKDDSRRPLTKAGKRKMKEVAAGLLEVVESLDVIAASPLVRAQQTAEIVAEAYGDLRVDTVQALSPGSDPADLVDWLGKHASAEVVAIVGHEPHLGILVTWFMTGASDSRVEMSKGGAALLDFSSRVTAGSGTLEWVLTGSQLRSIGR